MIDKNRVDELIEKSKNYNDFRVFERDELMKSLIQYYQENEGKNE